MGVIYGEETVMHHFFTETEFFTKSEAVITGPDVNHIRNVLRMKPGERILLSDGKGTNCLCELTEIGSERVTARILQKEVKDTELPVEVTLFQGLPKGDKMDYVVQKCVELGVTRIVPTETERCVARLDAKKAEARRKRWQAVAESAAKQSKRMRIPAVLGLMRFADALKAAGEYDLALIPYEDSESLADAGGMKRTRELIGGLKPGRRVAVLIGPEGGFSDAEIERALSAGLLSITLGKRILRTETAGLFVLAAMGLLLEE